MIDIPRRPFYFLRHGETDHNVKKILSGGDTDIPLNTKGMKQAEDVSLAVKVLPIGVIFHSPMQRATETMRRASEGLILPRKEAEAFRECFGHVWLDMNQNNRSVSNFSSETTAFFSRVAEGLSTILKLPETPLIVSHGGVHWALCHLLAIENHPYAIDNCTLVHFSPSSTSEWKGKVLNS